MPKKKINFKKIFCSWFFWTIVYGAVTDIFSCAVLDFSPLSLSDWGMRIGDLCNERWIIKTGKDWSLLLLMIAFVPVYFIGWRKAYVFDWGRIVPRRFRKKDPAFHRPAGTAISKNHFVPQKLRVQTSALLSVKASDAQTPVSSTTPVSSDSSFDEPIPPMGGQSVTPNISLASQYEDAAEVQQMLSQTTAVQADFFPHILLDGHYASFAMSTEKLAAVFRIINRPESVFAVDTEVDINASDWFYESGLIQAPAKDIIAVSQILQANESDSVATPVILLMGGSLLNVEETMAYFEKNNIMLLRTENVDIDEIPLVSDFMRDYFGLREEEV